MLIVQICDFGNDGDYRYRIHEPSRYLGKLAGVTVVDCHFSQRHLRTLADAADVLVMQFVNDWDLLDLVRRRRALGKPTVFEANDDFFDIQSWSPNATAWRDRSLQELYRQWLGQADGVQTSSDTLAGRWRTEGAAEVAVFTNHLTDVPPLRTRENLDQPLTIGWGGSPGHFADWLSVAPALTSWLGEHPEIRLNVMTNESAKPFFNLPDDRYKFTPFGTLDDYYAFLGTLDIGIAPLLPTPYNRGRSDVKFLEYASRGVAGIYADLEPYRQSVVNGETGLLFRTPDELIHHLERLRTDHQLRGAIRRNAYKHIARERRLVDHIGKRLQWYKQLVEHASLKKGTAASNGSQAADHVRTILAEGKREGSYIALQPGRVEQSLNQAIRMTDTNESINIIRKLVDAHPNDLRALQIFGRRCNDRREPRLAIDVLERARALDPTHPSTLAELARSQVLLGNDDAAKGLLDEAVAKSQSHLPAWSSLLRLLALTRQTQEGNIRADQVERIFPNAYPIALQGLAARPPDDRADALIRLLDRFNGNIQGDERLIAATPFRQAIFDVIGKTETAAKRVDVLNRACRNFPESAKLAAAYGTALHQTGRHDDAFHEEVRALDIRRKAAFDRDEFPNAEAQPIAWKIAEPIVKAQIKTLPVNQSRKFAELMNSLNNNNNNLSSHKSDNNNNNADNNKMTAELRQRAYRFYQEGKANEALAAARRLVEQDPKASEGWYLLGVIAIDSGDTPGGLESFGKASLLDPKNHVIVNAIGEAKHKLGQFESAEAGFCEAIAFDPTYARAHNNLGRSRHAAGDRQAAERSFREAVRLQPDYANALNNLGAILQEQERLQEACRAFEQAIAAKPGYPEAHFNLGCVRQAQGDLVEAVKHLQAAIRSRNDYGRAHFHLGQVLESLRRDYDALHAYQTAAKLLPNDHELHRRLGLHLVVKKDWPLALAALQRAHELAPGEASTFASLFNARQQICDWQGYEAATERLWNDTQAQIAEGTASTVGPFQSLTLPWPLDRLHQVARSHAKAWEKTSKYHLSNENDSERSAFMSTARGRRNCRDGRIRVGYLTGDIHDHPISHLLQGFFGRHDRDRFEVTIYSFGPADSSSYRHRIMAEVEHFVEVGPLSRGATVDRIQSDRIDILVDLMGYTGANRLSTFALRPAPIQVSFLGMLGTTGADYIDYLITDAIVSPPEHAPYFTEAFVKLPDCYLIAEPEPEFEFENNLSDAPIDRKTLGLPDDGFVFCCFNSAYKIEPRSFDSWMRILSNVPGSVLWLCSPGKIVEENLRREAQDRGVDPGRLVFAPFVKRAEHLKRHRAADLFLDTFHYNAAATASLSLQVGVPVLTCLGDTFASRVGGSIVNAAGLPDLVASTPAEFERRAIQLANDPESLRAIRRLLESTRTTSPLFDTGRFVKNLESAYKIMVDRLNEGLLPAPFKVVDQIDDEFEGAPKTLALSR